MWMFITAKSPTKQGTGPVHGTATQKACLLVHWVSVHNAGAERKLKGKKRLDGREMKHPIQIAPSKKQLTLRLPWKRPLPRSAVRLSSRRLNAVRSELGTVKWVISPIYTLSYYDTFLLLFHYPHITPIKRDSAGVGREGADLLRT